MGVWVRVCVRGCCRPCCPFMTAAAQRRREEQTDSKRNTHTQQLNKQKQKRTNKKAHHELAVTQCHSSVQCLHVKSLGSRQCVRYTVMLLNWSQKRCVVQPSEGECSCGMRYQE